MDATRISYARLDEHAKGPFSIEKNSRKNLSVNTKTKAHGISWLTLLILLTLRP
jgi:hypothetical protein